LPDAVFVLAEAVRVVSFRIVPLDRSSEDSFLRFLNRDRIGHYYVLYDLRYLRDRMRAWLALCDGEVQAFMMEYDGRILHIRGNSDCVAGLLSKSDLSAPLFNVEPEHLSTVRDRFEPTEPADKRTDGLITTFLTLKVTSESLRPLIRHDVQELNQTNVSDVAGLLEVEPQRARDLLRGVGFGLFKNGRLVSCAVSPEMLEDLAIIRGVHTAAEERNKGYSSSVCSVLVQQLLRQGRDVILFVSKDNPAAIRVYSKIGFKETGRVSLAFKARVRKVGSAQG